jgi:flagellar basal-body rod modification protein FlgD
MQNQDPTADTDPNEYIDQLVQVNSLEQLIDINQDLTPTSSSSGSSTSTASSAVTSSAANPAAKTTAAAAANSTADTSSAQTFAPGNLSVPDASSASQSVAHALDGQSRTPQTSVNGFPGVL